MKFLVIRLVYIIMYKVGAPRIVKDVVRTSLYKWQINV